MVRTILIIFLIYLIYRFVKFFLRNVKVTYRAGRSNYNQNNTYTSRQNNTSKYKNIEEAEFTEIKSEPGKAGQEHKENS